MDNLKTKTSEPDYPGMKKQCALSCTGWNYFGKGLPSSGQNARRGLCPETTEYFHLPNPPLLYGSKSPAKLLISSVLFFPCNALQILQLLVFCKVDHKFHKGS